jgi:type IV pilus assembly protein PilW
MKTSCIHARKHMIGFTLIELMIAIVLGLLVSIGLISLFGTTSSVSKTQNALALVQENGRFAITRMNSDLRMGSAPYCSGSSGPATLTTSNGALDQAIATSIYFTGLTFPDAVTATASAAPTGWPAGQLPYPLSPSANIQGYECDKNGTTCSPAVPTAAPAIPAQGTTAGSRVKGSDVLTLRYLQGTGWPITATPVANSAGTCAITATRAATDTPFNFAAGDRIFVGVCNNPIVAATSALSTSGNTLTATLTGLTGSTQAGCASWPLQTTHVYDYTKDFITVTYCLVYVADPNPDATAGRVIPTLVRRVNGVDSQIVQGVNRLDFLYGVYDNNGNVMYLTADKVNDRNGGTMTCPTPPAQFVNGATTYPDQTGCLWRAVKSIEVHMLLDTVNDLNAVGTNDTPYCYSIDPTTSLATVDCSSQTNYQIPAATDFNGKPGRMMRREFISLIGVRNAVL